ncbi:MAG: zinc dependent phospholipase C family protein [Chloroflexi bacterium]|nr:zinc dependent phospholipase C family protein [Chloroflexota bacterium]
MPPIVLHLGVARDVARALPELDVLQRHAGSFYLGSTAPDIRLLTGTAREETHFYDLGRLKGESGTVALFRAHPNLAPGTGLDDASRAFVAGYLSHLHTDEVWISEVWQPYFGASKEDSSAITQMLDRALQYELDLREREPSTMEAVRSALGSDSATPAVPFLDSESLARWREFVASATRRERSWEQFSQYAREFLVAQGKVTKEAVDAFLGDFAVMRQRILDYVPDPELRRFRQESVERSIVAARKYLG